MSHQIFQRYTVASVAMGCSAIVCSCPVAAIAGNSRTPDSFAKPTGDGQHMLVMLSTGPIAQDSGNECELPSGEKVNLRNTFPANGLYRIGSTTPIWTVPWNDWHSMLHISPDGRYVAYINRFGDGGYYPFVSRPGRKLTWAVKFYDQGTEFRSHDVTDLVDYPSLMRFTSSDWHLTWYDDSSLVTSANGELFVDVQTSTRDRFRFDLGGPPRATHR